jgi:ribosome-binding factor A
MKQDRITRVNRLVQETLAAMIPAVKDPRVSRASVLSVVGVQTTPDLRHAKVFLSIAGEEQVQREVLAGLNHARGFLRSELGRAVRLRSTPELHFVIDETIERASRIEGILREIADEAPAVPAGDPPPGDPPPDDPGPREQGGAGDPAE